MAALESNFFATFNKVDSKLNSTNARLREYRTTWQAVANAQKQGIISTNAASNAYKQMNNSLSKTPTTKVNDLGKGLQSLMNLKLWSMAGNALTGLGKSIISTAAEFEAGMSKVKAITGADANAMKLLTAQAKELGRTTKFSATQSAEAMSYLGMASWDTQQILKVAIRSTGI